VRHEDCFGRFEQLHFCLHDGLPYRRFGRGFSSLAALTLRFEGEDERIGYLVSEIEWHAGASAGCSGSHRDVQTGMHDRGALLDGVDAV
jgi:hypothetical protein